jgi:hypothetical protein
MSKFPSPGTMEWVRKIDRCQDSEQVVQVVKSMDPPCANPVFNCTHEAYAVCLSQAAVKYIELVKKEESDVRDM